MARESFEKWFYTLRDSLENALVDYLWNVITVLQSQAQPARGAADFLLCADPDNDNSSGDCQEIRLPILRTTHHFMHRCNICVIRSPDRSLGWKKDDTVSLKFFIANLRGFNYKQRQGQKSTAFGSNYVHAWLMNYSQKCCK